MRMDQSQALTARTIVNDWSEDMGIATVALGQTVTM